MCYYYCCIKAERCRLVRSSLILNFASFCVVVASVCGGVYLVGAKSLSLWQASGVAVNVLSVLYIGLLGCLWVNIMHSFCMHSSAGVYVVNDIFL
jgi:hypothetical protein